MLETIRYNENNESEQTDNNLNNLIKQVDELKDFNKDNDKIEGVFEETEGEILENALNKGLLDSLNKLKIGEFQKLVSKIKNEIKNIYENPNLNLSDDVKKSVEALLKLLDTELTKRKSEFKADKFEIPEKNGKYEYLDKLTGEPAKNIAPEQAKECFYNGLNVAAELMEGQQQWAILSSGSLFLNNPNYMKLGGDIDIATDVETFNNVAINKGENGKTKLEEFVENEKITDLKFTRIYGGGEIDINNKDEVNNLIQTGNIKVEFNIPSKDGLLISSEFFPEPRGYGLIQLGTERTEGKVNTYSINGREIKTVNEELAAKSYLINLANEFKNNDAEARENATKEGKRLPKTKDAVRINNLLQYLSSTGIKTPDDIIKFIDETKTDYENQRGTEFKDEKTGEKMDMSKYLKDGLNGFEKLKGLIEKVKSMYNTVRLTEGESWGKETTISFNQFTIETYELKAKIYNGKIDKETALIEIEKLKAKINIEDDQNFAYYYEIYQIQTNFIEKLFKDT